MDDLARSNSLTNLAARIRTEHAATSAAFKSSIKHAMAAGDLLIEAKAQLQHGRWLPWLRDHCTISERTAQLYMRVAKNRAMIETQIRNDVADLSLGEVAALLMLSSDVHKLLSFAKQADDISGGALIDFCIANDVGVIVDRGYNPFAGRSEAEKLEWLIFTVFLSYDGAAGRGGFGPDDAAEHVEYLLQRPFQNVAQWLGPAGEEWRRLWNGNRHPPEQFKTGWAAFLDAHRHATLDDVEAEHLALRTRFQEDKAAGKIKSSGGCRRTIRARPEARQ